MTSELVQKTLLLDFYGPLLTERQQEIMRLVCEEDLSLSEAAEQLGFSRQAAYDAVAKSESLLAEYEAKLGFVAQFLEQQERLKAALQKIERGSVKSAVGLLEGMVEL